jgi:hypothetical protein
VTARTEAAPATPDPPTPTVTPSPTPVLPPLSITGRIGGGGDDQPSIVADGNAVYVGESRHVFAYDVSDPSRPRELDQLPLPPVPERRGGWRNILSLEAHEKILYVFELSGRTHLVDISQPGALALAGQPFDVGESLEGGLTLRETALDDDESLVVLLEREDDEHGSTGELRRIDISDPLRPAIDASLDLPKGAWDMVVDDGRALVAGWNTSGPSRPRQGLWVVDVRLPGEMRQIQELDWTGLDGDSYPTLAWLTAADGWAYVSGWGFAEFDTGRPDDPYGIAALRWDEPAARYEKRGLVSFDQYFAPETEDDCAEAQAENRALIFGTPGPRRYCGDRVHAFPRHWVVVNDVLWVLQDLSDDLVQDLVFAVSLRSFDLEDPSRPRDLGSVHTNLQPPSSDMAVIGTTAVIPLSNQRLVTFDLSDPEDPRQQGTFQGLGRVDTVQPVPDRAGWLATSRAIVDATHPESPRRVARSAGGHLAGSYVYRAQRWEGLIIEDISEPSHPREVARVEVPGYALWVFVDESASRAYVGHTGHGTKGLRWQGPEPTDGILVFDVSSADAPKLLWEIDASQLLPLADRPLSVLAYERNTFQGFHAIGSNARLFEGQTLFALDVSSSEAQQPLGRFDVTSPARLIGPWAPLGDEMLVMREAVLEVGRYEHRHLGGDLVVLDLTDPTMVREVGRLPMSTERPGALGVVGDLALLADDTGFHVVDLGDVSSPRIVGSFANPYPIAAISVADGIVYLAAGTEGLLITSLDALHQGSSAAPPQQSGASIASTVWQ